MRSTTSRQRMIASGLPLAATFAMATTALAQTVSAPVGQIIGAKDGDLMLYQGNSA